jgi:tripartite ATP-independent transporter DctM subunit
MNELRPGAEPFEAGTQPLPAWQRWLRSVEDGLLGLVLAALVILPLTESVTRKLGWKGIRGSSDFIQHFTMLISVLGGVMAARSGRLLTLSSLPNQLKGRWKSGALILSGAFAVAVSVVLAAAGWQFVHAESARNEIAYGITRRAFQIFLPLGFALVAVRLWWHSAAGWKGRALSLALSAVLLGLALKTPVAPAALLWPALAALAVATVLGAPIFVTLGGAAMILLWTGGRQVSLIPLEHYYLVTDPLLPSLPLFTLAGYFLAEGGASRRLVHVFETWFGGFRGGHAIVTALVCAFFTSFTGASGVTILALGPVLMPVLLQAKYSERTALGLVTGAGSLGLLFPPCLPLILYAVIAQRTLQSLELPPGTPVPEVTINQLFLGGIGPGVLLVVLTAWWAIRAGPKEKVERPAFAWRDAGAALAEAKWELLLPVVTLGVLFSGLATPVEAAAVAALYAFFTQVVVHRDLHWFKDVPRVVAECGLIIGGVLLILGVAMGLTKFLILADVPTAGVEWIQRAIHSKWVFLILLNLFLLAVGCLMNIYSAIVVVVPLIVPMALVFGVDPVHLGIIFLANLEIGFLMPPVGVNLFLSSYRFQKPMGTVVRSVLPMIVVLLVGVLLITYVPPLTTALPKLLKKNSPPALGPKPGG